MLNFLGYIVLFVDDSVDEECEEFSKSKILAWNFCLAFAWFFCQFQSGVAYKSVVYKKACIAQGNMI